MLVSITDFILHIVLYKDMLNHSNVGLLWNHEQLQPSAIIAFDVPLQQIALLLTFDDLERHKSCFIPFPFSE